MAQCASAEERCSPEVTRCKNGFNDTCFYDRASLAGPQDLISGAESLPRVQRRTLRGPCGLLHSYGDARHGQRSGALCGASVFRN